MEVVSQSDAQQHPAHRGTLLWQAPFFIILPFWLQLRHDWWSPPVDFNASRWVSGWWGMAGWHEEVRGIWATHSFFHYRHWMKMSYLIMFKKHLDLFQRPSNECDHFFSSTDSYCRMTSNTKLCKWPYYDPWITPVAFAVNRNMTLFYVVNLEHCFFHNLALSFCCLVTEEYLYLFSGCLKNVGVQNCCGKEACSKHLVYVGMKKSAWKLVFQ